MEMYSEELRAKARKISWFFTDVDGTLTDGQVYYGANGEALKAFSLRDGSGVFLLKQAGIKFGIITGEESPIVEQRAKKLKVDKLLMNAVPKVEILTHFLESENLSLENVAFIGDGINDVKLLKAAGLGFAVNDAHSLAKENADIICTNNGGNGAFLEAVEILLNLRGESVQDIIESKL